MVSQIGESVMACFLSSSLYINEMIPLLRKGNTNYVPF